MDANLYAQLRPMTCVCTTINDGEQLFRRYYENLVLHNRLENVSLVVIPDLKTPPTIAENAQRYRAQGLDIRLLGIDEQKSYLEKYPELDIPFNSDNRRNVGYLFAAEHGAATIVSIDDDNFPLPTQDFTHHHVLVGKEHELAVVSSANRWYNFLEFAKTSNHTTIYPRGFPHHRRHASPAHTWSRGRCKVAINAGLWTNHPDVDAITRIDNPAKILAYHLHENIAVAHGTFVTINSQNTAFNKNVLPCYYFIPQGYLLNGMPIDRFGDIWQGLFAKKCIDTMGEHVSIGNPVCSHERNTHNLFRDLRQELGAIECTQDIAEFLENVELQGASYADVYRDLARKLDRHFAEHQVKYSPLMQQVSAAMLRWADASERALNANQ